MKTIITKLINHENTERKSEIYLPDLLQTSSIKSNGVLLDGQTIVEHVNKYEPVLTEIANVNRKAETNRVIQAYIHDDAPDKLLELQTRYNDISWATKSRMFDHFIIDTANSTISNNKIAFDELQRVVSKIRTPIDFSAKIQGFENKKFFIKETHEGILHVTKNVSQFVQTRDYLEITDKTFVFLKNYLTDLDLSFLSKLSFLNERLVAIVLIPHLIRFLGKRDWGHVLALSFYTGKLSSFITSIAAKISTKVKTVYGNYSPTVKIKFIGIAGLVSLVAIKTNIFKLLYPTSVLVKQLSLHEGVSDISGYAIGLFRLEGSKWIYEATRTLSTFLNAALAGFLEPNKEIIKQLLKDLPKK